MGMGRPPPRVRNKTFASTAKSHRDISVLKGRPKSISDAEGREVHINLVTADAHDKDGNVIHHALSRPTINRRTRKKPSKRLRQFATSKAIDVGNLLEASQKEEKTEEEKDKDIKVNEAEKEEKKEFTKAADNKVEKKEDKVDKEDPKEAEKEEDKEAEKEEPKEAEKEEAKEAEKEEEKAERFHRKGKMLEKSR
eukprot:scpid93214/ scgid26717/ 